MFFKTNIRKSRIYLQTSPPGVTSFSMCQRPCSNFTGCRGTQMSTSSFPEACSPGPVQESTTPWLFPQPKLNGPAVPKKKVFCTSMFGTVFVFFRGGISSACINQELVSDVGGKICFCGNTYHKRDRNELGICVEYPRAHFTTMNHLARTLIISELEVLLGQGLVWWQGHENPASLGKKGQQCRSFSIHLN